MATIDLGKIAFTQKGTWASGTAYTEKDVVQYTDGNDTSSYVAIASSTGQAPSTNGTLNSSNWAIFAKGADIGSTYQSTYAGGTTYKKGDVVQYTDGDITSSFVYVNTTPASGQTPATGGTVNTTYWSYLAKGQPQSFNANDLTNDISTLALRQSTNEDKSAYNTNSMYVDVFQDSTGVTNLTNTQRASGEFVASVVPNTDSHYSNVYGIFENSSTNETTNQSGAASTTALTMGNQSFSTTQKKFGTHSIYFATNRSASSANSCDFNPSGIGSWESTSNIYTVEMFIYQTARKSAGVDPDYEDSAIWAVGDTYSSINVGSSGKVRFNQYNGGRQFGYWDSSYILPLNQWVHVAIVWNGSYVKAWFDGVYKGAIGRIALNSSCPDGMRLGASAGGTDRSFEGYMDNIRITKAERYTGTDNIAVPTVEHYPNGQFNNASGSFESNAITADATTSKMGAVVTYEDASGTNTLNTDIVLKLSADNGSNYATATLVAQPDFATGTKMAKVNDVSVTGGTQLKYKMEFANQSDGVKVAKIRGVSLMY